MTPSTSAREAGKDQAARTLQDKLRRRSRDPARGLTNPRTSANNLVSSDTTEEIFDSVALPHGRYSGYAGVRHPGRARRARGCEHRPVVMASMRREPAGCAAAIVRTGRIGQQLAGPSNESRVHEDPCRAVTCLDPTGSQGVRTRIGSGKQTTASRAHRAHAAPGARRHVAHSKHIAWREDGRGRRNRWCDAQKVMESTMHGGGGRS